jgi:hypothetical protein
MMFAAKLAPFSWISASVVPTGPWWHASSIDAGSVPHELVMLAEVPQHRAMDTLPKACFHPFVKAAPARRTAAAAEFTRKVFPGYSSHEDGQSAGQRCVIVDTWPSAPFMRERSEVLDNTSPKNWR